MNDYYSSMKKSKYRALLYKMQSVSTKNSYLTNKINNTKSLLKMTLNIDNDILDSSLYNGIAGNCNDLDNSVKTTISTIKSNL